MRTSRASPVPNYPRSLLDKHDFDITAVDYARTFANHHLPAIVGTHEKLIPRSKLPCAARAARAPKVLTAQEAMCSPSLTRWNGVIARCNIVQQHLAIGEKQPGPATSGLERLRNSLAPHPDII